VRLHVFAVNNMHLLSLDTDSGDAPRMTVMPLAANEPRERKGRPPPTPWARLLRHPALWAIVVNNFTFHYAFYVVMNWLPTYFDKARRRGRLEG